MKDDTMPTPATATEERWLHGAVESGHRGKGPKNYHRTDPRIFEDVSEALTDNDAVDASNVEVTVKDGEVLLDGAVETQRMKEIAGELVSAVSGVKSVRNMLRTQPRAD
jgi:osmotically-inducible protein OsmY